MADTPEVKPLPDVTKGWGTETFSLRYPFIFRGMEYRDLTVRVPTGLDIRAYVEAREPGYEPLAHRIVDTPKEVLENMHGVDYARLMARMGEFIGGVR